MRDWSLVVTLPIPSVLPPIRKISARLAERLGSMARAIAMLVSGPSATRLTCPGRSLASRLGEHHQNIRATLEVGTMAL